MHGNSWDESKFDLNALLINVCRSGLIFLPCIKYKLSFR